MKKISEMNLNAFIANRCLDKTIEAAGEKTNETSARLARVVLRKTTSHKMKARVPLYAFVKNVGSKLAIKVLTTGVTAIVESSNIFSVSEVKGDFSIGGVTYGVKDTINGCPRYKAKKSAL